MYHCFIKIRINVVSIWYIRSFNVAPRKYLKRALSFMSPLLKLVLISQLKLPMLSLIIPVVYFRANYITVRLLSRNNVFLLKFMLTFREITNHHCWSSVVFKIISTSFFKILLNVFFNGTVN